MNEDQDWAGTPEGDALQEALAGAITDALDAGIPAGVIEATFDGMLGNLTPEPEPAPVIPAREYEIGYDAEREMQDWMNEIRSGRAAEGGEPR